MLSAACATPSSSHSLLMLTTFVYYYFPSYPVLRDKGELQLNIRSLKETNMALSAINKGLEETLFKVREEL